MQMCVIHRIRHRHKKNLSTARKMKQWQKDCRSVQQVIWSSQHRSSSSSLRLFWVSFFLELFSKCLVWSFLVFLRFKMLTFWSFENFFKYFKTKLYFQNKFTRFSVFFPNFMCLLNFHRKIVLFCFFLLRKINLFRLFSLFFIYFAQISTWFIPFSAQKWYLPMISQDFSRKNTQNQCSANFLIVNRPIVKKIIFICNFLRHFSWNPFDRRKKWIIKMWSRFKHLIFNN